MLLRGLANSQAVLIGCDVEVFFLLKATLLIALAYLFIVFVSFGFPWIWLMLCINGYPWYVGLASAYAFLLGSIMIMLGVTKRSGKNPERKVTVLRGSEIQTYIEDLKKQLK